MIINVVIHHQLNYLLHNLYKMIKVKVVKLNGIIHYLKLIEVYYLVVLFLKIMIIINVIIHKIYVKIQNVELDSKIGVILVMNN